MFTLAKLLFCLGLVLLGFGFWEENVLDAACHILVASVAFWMLAKLYAQPRSPRPRRGR